MKKLWKNLENRQRWLFSLFLFIVLFVSLGLVPLAMTLEKTEQLLHHSQAERILELARHSDPAAAPRDLWRIPEVRSLHFFDRQGVVTAPLGQNPFVPPDGVEKVLSQGREEKKIGKNRWQLGALVQDSHGESVGGVLLEYAYGSYVEAAIVSLLLFFLALTLLLGKIFWPSAVAKDLVAEEDFSWLACLDQCLDQALLLTDSEGKIIAAGSKVPSDAKHLFDVPFSEPERLWRGLQEGEHCPGVRSVLWKDRYLLCIEK